MRAIIACPECGKKLYGRRAADRHHRRECGK